jgi:hypothetical protein
LLVRVAGEGIEARDRIDLIAEELEPDCLFVSRCGIDFDDIAAHAEFAAAEVHVVAAVEHVDQRLRTASRVICWPFFTVSSMRR